MQKSIGAKSTARRRPLRVLSGNKARPAPESLLRKPPPPAATTPAARAPVATTPAVRAPVAATPAVLAPADAADAALDRLLLARSDLAGIVSQIDELIFDALQCQNVSKRGNQDIESFFGFLSDTNSSLKQWSSRLKQALETGPAKNEDVSEHTLGACSNSVAKGKSKLVCCSSSNFLSTDTDPVASPCSNFTEADMIVSPSPLVSWRTGSCMVESGKQLFLLTPLPKTKACSSRCPTSNTQLKTASSMNLLNLPSLPVRKLTISDDDRPDLEQGVEVKEARPGTMTPHVTTANKDSSEDKSCSPRTFSIQKSARTLPRSCLKTASKQPLFSPIPEGSRKEEIASGGSTQGDKSSVACGDISSDEVSKDLASRYDIYGINQYTKSTYHRREANDPLQWFLSPLKTCVLMEPSYDKPIPTPGTNNLKGKQDASDDKPIQTPAVHSTKALLAAPWKGLESSNQTPAVRSTKALLATTPWKGVESTNLKGRQAGETTLKKELWTRFEAASTNELHFNKSLFQKNDGKCFLDMLEEAS